MKVGILGAGQLSRMLALAGMPLGFEFVFYDQVATKCVENLGKFFQGDYTDFDALGQFLSHVDVVTYENENIPIDCLQYISDKGLRVDPCIAAIKVMQDRLLEKDFLNSLDIPTAAYRAVNNIVELNAAVHDFSLPVIIKQRTHGYDGRGQIFIRTQKDLDAITNQDLNNAIVEGFVHFDREISLVGCRDLGGNDAFYDVCQNVHESGILRHTVNVQNDPMFEAAKGHLTKIMDALNYVGVCTAEFFVVDNNLVVNELAPRVHNTGHWTIEGATVSQFENHVRCIAGYPIGDTSSLGNFEMHNIIGTFPDAKELLAKPGLHLHDYRKAPKPDRKIGHMTFYMPNSGNAANGTG